MGDRRAAWLVLVLIGAAQVAPALLPPGDRGTWNWEPIAGQAQAEVTTIARHGQLPLWNPWRAGGMPAYADPQSMLLTPVTPLALAFGVMPAFKLVLVPALVLGAFGAWMLAGRLSLTGAARLVPALVLFGSTVPAQYVAAGLPNWLLGFALLPWLLWAFDRAIDDLRFVPLAGLAWAGVLWCGDAYHFVFDPLVVALWAAGRGLERRSVRPLLVGLGVGLAGTAFAAVRLLPLLDVYARTPRLSGSDVRFVTPVLLLRLLADPWLSGTLSPLGFLELDGLRVDWATTYAYVGPVALVLAALALGRPRRALAPLLVALGFAWLACGPALGLDPWAWLTSLPVYASMRLPERLTQSVLVGVALLAGLGCAPLAGRARTAALLLLVATGLVPALAIGWPHAAGAFPLPPAREPDAVPPFRQTAVMRLSRASVADQQVDVLRNVGNVAAHRDLPTPERVVPEGNPRYRGEVHLLSDRGTVDATVTPNVVRVRAELEAADVLVLNQNWFPGWTASGSVDGPMIEHEGRPALALPAGAHDLALRFEQPSVARGALLTGLAMLVVLAHLLWARGPRPGFGAPEAAGALALAALLAAAGPPPIARRRPRAEPPPPRTHALPRDPDRAAAVLGAASPGDVVRLPGGRLPSLVVTRGVTLEGGDDAAPTRLGRLVIADLPHGETLRILGGVRADGLLVRACDGDVVAQDVVVGDGDGALDEAAVERAGPPDLLVADSEHVVLLGGEVRGDARVRVSTLVASGTAFGARLEAERARVLLADPAVGGPLVLRGTRLLAEAPARASWPRLVLRDGSRALLRGGRAPPPPEVDATSALAHDPPPPVRVARAALDPRGVLRVHVQGRPGARAHLFVGQATTLIPCERDDDLLLVDVHGHTLRRAVTLGPDGTHRERLRVPATGPGAGWFAQAGAERDAGSFDLDLSLVAGVLTRGEAR